MSAKGRKSAKIGREVNRPIVQQELEEDDEMSDDEEWARDGLDEDVYYVERIEQKGLVSGEVRYFVKWRGYPSDQNTWESLENLNGSMAEVLEFEKRVEKVKGWPNNATRKRELDKLIVDGEATASEHQRQLRAFNRAPERIQYDIESIVAFLPKQRAFVVKYTDNKISLLLNDTYNVSQR